MPVLLTLKPVLSSYGSYSCMFRVRGLVTRVEERRVRGTGGVCRSRGDRGGEPLDINIPVQLSRGGFNVVQRSRNRTRIRTRTEPMGDTGGLETL